MIAKLESAKEKHKVLRRLLGDPTAQPLTCLKRDQVGPQGQDIGTYTMQPAEIDAITQRAWKKVYDGNCSDGRDRATDFFSRLMASKPSHSQNTIWRKWTP